MKALTIVLLLAVSLLSFSKNKTDDLEWKTGILVGQNSQRVCRIIDGDSVCSLVTSFAVDTGDMLFTVSRGTHWRWDKEMDVTVNAPIKYAIDGKKFYLQDEHGKPHEVSIVQKARKP